MVSAGGNGNLQLEAPRVIHLAGDAHRSLTGAGPHIVDERGVVRGPVDEVDQQDAEGVWVRVHRVPCQLKVAASCEGCVDVRVGEADRRNERGAKGEGLEDAHGEGFGTGGIM